MPTVAVHLSLFAGDSGLSLKIYSGGTLINTGGDTLVETANGYFTANVAETLTGLLRADVVKNSAVVYQGWLNPEVSLLVDAPTVTVTVNTSISIPAQVAAQIKELGRLTLYRATTFSYTLTGLGDLTNVKKIYFTIRPSTIHDDSKSLAQIMLTVPGSGSDGLQYIDKAVATDKSKGSLTLVNAVTGSVAVRLHPEVTALLDKKHDLDYDVKWVLNDNSIPLPAIGKIDIEDVVTEALT